MKRRTAAFVWLALVAASLPLAAGTEVLRKPELGLEARVGPGEVVYAETIVRVGERVFEAAVLLQSVAIDDEGPRIVAGASLVRVVPQVDSPMHFAGAVPGTAAWCVDSLFEPGALGGAKRFLCFQDVDNDRRFDRAVVKGYSRKRSYAMARYELRTVTEPVPSERHTFKGELLYQGAGGGVLRLAYREYTDDLARPAFSQDVTYDLHPGSITTDVRFKGALLKVLSANNSEIRYFVAEPFKW